MTTVTEMIKDKEYILERIRFSHSNFTRTMTTFNEAKVDYQTRLINEILILREIEAEEMKVFEK